MTKLGAVRQRAVEEALEDLCQSQDDLIGIAVVTIWLGDGTEKPSVITAVRSREVLDNAFVRQVARESFEEAK